MDNFITKVKEKTKEYGEEPSALSISLAIEFFQDIRTYPASWSDSKKLADMEKNIFKIAMASIEIESKNGAENQLSHNEQGTNRTYYNGIMAYKDVVCIVGVL